MRGGLGGGDESLERPLSFPRIEGENGEHGLELERSVLNLNMLLVHGLIGEEADPWPPPAGDKELETKSDPKSSDFKSLEYASFPPSFTGVVGSLSCRSKAWRRDEDLQGMNLSLQVDFEGEDKVEIPRNELENVSRRSEVWFIPAGRFKPVLVFCGDSIFSDHSLIVVIDLIDIRKKTNNRRRRRLQKKLNNLLN